MTGLLLIVQALYLDIQNGPTPSVYVPVDARASCPPVGYIAAGALHASALFETNIQRALRVSREEHNLRRALERSADEQVPEALRQQADRELDEARIKRAIELSLQSR